MSVTKEEIDKYLKKVKIGDRGYFNKENGGLNYGQHGNRKCSR